MNMLSLADLTGVPSLENNFDDVAARIVEQIRDHGTITADAKWTISIDIQLGADIDKHTDEATPTIEAVSLKTIEPALPVEQFRSGRIILKADPEAVEA